MKVCIIGSGSQGTGLAGLLAMEPDVELLILADYFEESIEKAYALIQSLGERIKVPEIRKQQVNAADTGAVAEVIRGCDVVFHAIIPKFNVSIMKACIQEKAGYLDLFAAPFAKNGIAYEETIDAQFDLDQAFQDAGCLALPSIGMSPGWTSLASQKLIDEFDTIGDVIIRWADFVDTDAFFAPISPITVFQEWFGAPYPLRNVKGTPTQVDLLESEETFEFPEPIGKRNIFTVTAHPDIVLIPMFAGKNVNSCEEKGGIFLGSHTMQDTWLRAIQKAASRQGTATESCNMLEKFSRELIPPTEYDTLLQQGRIKEHAVCFSCEVNGTIEGRFVRRISYYTSTRKEAQKHLPWASPAVYGTIGGLPIELVLAMGRKQLPFTGVKCVSELHMADKMNASLVERGHQLTEKTIW